MVKNLLAMQEIGFDPWVGKLPTPVFLPGEFHGQKSHGVARSRHD